MRFTIKGPPVPKARARVVQTAGQSKPHAITPPKTKAYENLVRKIALSARSHEPSWRLDWPAYSVQIEIYRSSPLSAGRGDIDNFCKSILDACNGVLWIDDARVTYLEAAIYDVSKGEERASVTVEGIL